MQIISSLCDSVISNFNEETIIEKLGSNDKFLQKIVELNTKYQLFKGVDSTGVKLSSIGGNYAPSTIAKKKRKGLPTYPTLYDTGKFYASFYAKLLENEIYTFADFKKTDGKQNINLTDRWGKELAGITEDNLPLLREEAKIIIIEILKEIISKAA